MRLSVLKKRVRTIFHRPDSFFDYTAMIRARRISDAAADSDAFRAILCLLQNCFNVCAADIQPLRANARNVLDSVKRLRERADVIISKEKAFSKSPFLCFVLTVFHRKTFFIPARRRDFSR